jgi:hypothetical protein
MKLYKLKDFTRGWIVGDFEPSIIRTKDAEFMVRYYKKGDAEAKHVHKKADEITVIISGRFKMNGKELLQGDIAHLSPGDPVDFECLEDGANAVFKAPSVMGDKYLID